jgi:hypothetical protein
VIQVLTNKVTSWSSQENFRPGASSQSRMVGANFPCELATTEVERGAVPITLHFSLQRLSNHPLSA